MSEQIVLENLNDQEKQALVVMFFARLPKEDPRYKLRNEYWEVLSKRFNRKWTTYKQDKDALDFYFESNGRKGWSDDRPLERRGIALKEVYERFHDADDSELQLAVEEIIDNFKQEDANYISMRIAMPEQAHKLIGGAKQMMIDGIGTLKESFTMNKIIFIVLGGDKGKSSVDWETGFYAIAHVITEPYDVGYKKSSRGGDYFKIDIEIDCVFERAVPRSDFLEYQDAYDAPFIGPELHRDPSQAVCTLGDTQAVAIIRAIIDMMPGLKQELERVFDSAFMERVLGAVKMLIPTDVEYGESTENAIDSYKEEVSAKAEKENEDKQEILDQYTKEDFLKEVFLSSEQYDLLEGIIYSRKNLILQGSPGVGKTFMAKRLAYSLMGVKDPSRIQMVQFHQSYSYEDFIIGYRPTSTGFKLETGPFYDFCKKAEKDSRPHFFIIDEINRGNVSNIFGELLMLIENDKRGEKLSLLYSGESFAVPSNVYIIGMMNTADRSLAIIDYALRRRFAFFSVKPAFENILFENMIEEKESERLNRLVSYVKMLNTEICNDESLGEGFEVGHSYFCTDEKPITDMWLTSVVEYELIPLISEYWFDDKDKISEWSKRLREVEK